MARPRPRGALRLLYGQRGFAVRGATLAGCLREPPFHHIDSDDLGQKSATTRPWNEAMDDDFSIGVLPPKGHEVLRPHLPACPFQLRIEWSEEAKTDVLVQHRVSPTTGFFLESEKAIHTSTEPVAPTATLKASRQCFVLPNCPTASSASSTNSIPTTNSFPTSARTETSPSDGCFHAVEFFLCTERTSRCKAALSLAVAEDISGSAQMAFFADASHTDADAPDLVLETVDFRFLLHHCSLSTPSPPSPPSPRGTVAPPAPGGAGICCWLRQMTVGMRQPEAVDGLCPARSLPCPTSWSWLDKYIQARSSPGIPTCRVV